MIFCQEPGTNDEIASFCKRIMVTFLMSKFQLKEKICIRYLIF